MQRDAEAARQRPGDFQRLVVAALGQPARSQWHRTDQRRQAERGYNQALEIARPLARSLGVALHPRLTARVRETTAQSGVAPEQRQRNIAGAFAVPDAALVRGRHIGIVDDVMTSGGTLNELAATLKRHGAARVSNLVFARTPPH